MGNPRQAEHYLRLSITIYLVAHCNGWLVACDGAFSHVGTRVGQLWDSQHQDNPSHSASQNQGLSRLAQIIMSFHSWLQASMPKTLQGVRDESAWVLRTG
jgi:hypothetical protein